MNTTTEFLKKLSTARSAVLALIAALTLTGCYVEVSHELEADYDTDSHYSPELADFSTGFLVEAALIPVALSAETAGMVANPDSYTTPRSRTTSRAVIIETTYAYLFDDWDCDYGGYTETEAEASTTSYDDGYTHVDLWLTAQAYGCKVYSQGEYQTLNSNLSYDVNGIWDDWENKISSLDGHLSGRISTQYNGYFIEHRSLNFAAYAVSGNDIANRGQSRVELDDGDQVIMADFRTVTDTHMYRTASRPHYGTVKFSNAEGWVKLSFETGGVWRQDSAGFDRYYHWSDL